MDFLSQIGSTTTASTQSFSTIVVMSLLAVVCGIILALAYQITHRGFSYSQTFVHSLILIVLITTLVMLVISGNITRAFTLIGALSIIRFRSAVKNSLDIVYIFAAAVIGMGIGTGSSQLAIWSTVAIVTVLFILNSIHFGSPTHQHHVLRITTQKKSAPENMEELLSPYVKSLSLISAHSLQAGKLTELTFLVQFKKSTPRVQAITQLQKLSFVTQVSLLSPQGGSSE